MKIAITGHTSGLGLSFYNHATVCNDSLIGFSKSTGFDITDSRSRQDIVKMSSNCDVFINNAYDKYGQIDLLYDMYDQWHGKNKLIVTVGSYASNAAEWRLKPCLYSTVKKALDVTTYQLTNSHNRGDCKLMIFKPTYLGDAETQISYSYAATYLYNAIVNNVYTTTELVLLS